MNAKFLLDTNIPSEISNPSPDHRVVTWLDGRTSICLSVISLGEFRRGCSLLLPGKRRTELEMWFERYLPVFAAKTLPVTEAIANRWGILSALRQKMGVPLSVTDGLIAATAIEHNLTLVTRNVKDFVALGVMIINPWDA